MFIAGWVGLTVHIVHIHHEQIFVFVSDFLISLFQILIRSRHVFKPVLPLLHPHGDSVGDASETDDSSADVEADDDDDILETILVHKHLPGSELSLITWKVNIM